MTGYIGIGGKAKKVNSLYVGIGGKAKKVIKGYVGVGGKAKLWYSAQKLWTWEKHNIDTTTVYVEVTGSTSSTTRSSAFYVSSTYSFNSSTGQFTVNQTTQIANSSTGASNAKNKYYITLTGTSGSQTGSTVYKITNATYSTPYRRLTLTLQAIGSQSQTQQSMGSLIGTVTNADPTAYPVNGPQDGYWYKMIDYVRDMEITYTGSYVDSIVQMDNVSYRLLELTSSGTLAFELPVTADVWAIGGGGQGVQQHDLGSGGGGGFRVYASNVSLQNLTISIGAGESDGGIGSGGHTVISGDLAKDAYGGYGGHQTYHSQQGGIEYWCGYGGSGGGPQGGYGIYNTQVPDDEYDYSCRGQHLNMKPFESDYFTYPYGDGGGGPGFVKEYEPGGAGGTNGSNGYYGGSSGLAGGAGGGHYGGAAGDSSRYGNKNGAAATGYGSGGGAGGYYNQNYWGDAGVGYQGVCFIRIPL